MKVVLINSPIYDHITDCIAAGDEYLPPFGLGYLATCMKEHNWDVSILDAVQLGLSVAQILDELININPDVIGINIFSINISAVKRIIESYEFKTKVIIGGQCTKFIYDEIVKWNSRNEIIVIIGEGELAICDVLEDNSSEKPVLEIKNRKVYRINSASKYYPSRIDDLPLCRGLLDENRVVNHYGLNERSIITSRGCIYNCAFCGAARSLNRDDKVRLKSKRVVIKEIKELIEYESSIKCIRVLDDLFLKNEVSIHDAIDIFNEFDLNWRAMAHIRSFSSVSDDLLEKMKKSGCLELFIGIESGSPRIREIIKKAGTVDEVKDTARRILKQGIDIKGYFIYGFPTETEDDMIESLNLANMIFDYSNSLNGNFRTSVFQFRPYHGTELYNKYVGNPNELQFQENEKLTELISRRDYNLYTRNYSDCDEELLYDFINRTIKLGGQND